MTDQPPAEEDVTLEEFHAPALPAVAKAVQQPKFYEVDGDTAPFDDDLKYNTDD